MTYIHLLWWIWLESKIDERYIVLKSIERCIHSLFVVMFAIGAIILLARK